MTMQAMEIFRASEAPAFENGEGTITMAPSAEVGLGRMIEAGMEDGSVLKTLFDGPGFALHYAWFKPNYQLGRHSHSLDAIYYVVSGSLKLGSEWLGAGDGFFLPADVPYVYTVGPDGLELLEFRHSANFTTHVPGASKAFWDKAVETVRANHQAWLKAKPPRAARRVSL
jgi:hypothetical protein